METLNIQLFIEEHNKLAERFDEIRVLYYPNLFSMDTISVDGDKIVFNCSESFMGSLEHEAYTYTAEELKRPIDEWKKMIEDAKIAANEKRIHDTKVFEEQLIAQRKHQYEQLKKEFGNSKRNLKNK